MRSQNMYQTAIASLHLEGIAKHLGIEVGRNHNMLRCFPNKISIITYLRDLTSLCQQETFIMTP